MFPPYGLCRCSHRECGWIEFANRVALRNGWYSLSVPGYWLLTWEEVDHYSTWTFSGRPVFHYTACEVSEDMHTCACGKTLRGSSTKCRRCAALQELGLNASASADSIKSAYRLQVKKWHPDLHGKNKVRQSAFEERTKRINIAYKFLTTPSKGGGGTTPPRSPATPEPSRPQSSSTTFKSANRQAARSTKSQQPTDDKQQPLKSITTHRGRKRSSRQATAEYPQRDFNPWKTAFDINLINGTKAAKGLKKWANHEAERRASNIAFAASSCKSLGIEPNLQGYSLPEDAHADVLKSLWGGSVPNVMERTHAAKSDNQLFKRMENIKKAVETFANGIEQRNAKVATQDGGFIVSLKDVRERCIHLSTSIATASALIKREYIQPLRLADCCIELVYELEETRGLSQAECHELIKCALLAHGCTDEDVTPFDVYSVDRGTIRAKKEALVKRVLDSVNIMAQVMQNSKRHNVGS